MKTPPKLSPRSKPMAFFSDVQGNLEALDAVLAEISRRGIVEIYAAGNHLLGGAKPLDTWMRLSAINAHMTRGLKDVALVAMDGARLGPKTDQERAIAERFAQTRSELGEFVLARLRKLPEKVRVPLLDGSELVMVHGSPSDGSIEITHDLEDVELLALLGDDPADIVICGGAYGSFQRDVEGVRIVNVGSVSVPESRQSTFVIATPRMDGTLIEQVTVEY